MIRILSENRSARLDAKKWIDVEVTLSAGDALTTSFIVILDPVSERAGMRYRKVDMDGSRDVRGKPEDAFVNLSTREERTVQYPLTCALQTRCDQTRHHRVGNWF
jgi:hypothetical protein